ncbi:MAG: SprT family zinc-dependent metalloprotease [Candidatus Pacebacteria bacterium]|nr:SprT family zinc-dependent metalloprotease [Candidatus Paceibacterota bacterium]
MIDYTIRENRRARRINVTVRRDGSVLVTKPRRASMRDVETFIRQCEQWILRTQEKFSKFRRTTRVEPSKQQYEKYKQTALCLARQRIAYFNTFYRFPFSSITIRNQKSRWGSCSPKGVLSFNYRILFLPPHLADYLVVHELCHLQEMNHSSRFWELVARSIPDYLERPKELRSMERGLLIDS